MQPEEPPWVDGLTFSRVLDRTAARSGGRDALVFPQLGYRRTYGELAADVAEAARALMALGVARGEHVGIWATNWPEWLVLQLATGRIGAVLVNINPAYRAHELAYVLDCADVATLFLTDRFKDSDYFSLLEDVCPELARSAPGELHARRCPKLRRVVSIKPAKAAGMLSWEEFIRLAGSVTPSQMEERTARVQADDVVNIQFTSGTTGFPKGAMLTHRNLLMNAYYVGANLRFSDADRLCIPVPFYHCFGCVIGTLLCVVYGAAMVVPAESFDPLATLLAVRDERCTGLHGVPTMFIAELNHPRFEELRPVSLRTGIMAGSPCPIEVMRQVVDRMGAREITIAYGQTESSPGITQTLPSDDLDHRVGTIGTALPGVEVRIVAPGTLDELPSGHPGELIARGHNVMKGYYRKPDETAAAVTPHGWLRTGDLALRTEDGYFRITGRIKDMIIRGGEKVYPREVEEYLYTHPGIADVQVVGLPDPRMGEEVSAWIRLKAGAGLSEDDVRAFCKGRIAHYKVPRYVAFVDEYPTTVTGKVQKFKLRELGIRRFGLEAAASVETA